MKGGIIGSKISHESKMVHWVGSVSLSQRLNLCQYFTINTDILIFSFDLVIVIFLSSICIQLVTDFSCGLFFNVFCGYMPWNMACFDFHRLSVFLCPLQHSVIKGCNLYVSLLCSVILVYWIIIIRKIVQSPFFEIRYWDLVCGACYFFTYLELSVWRFWMEFLL